jgi:hypothetical protein
MYGAQVVHMTMLVCCFHVITPAHLPSDSHVLSGFRPCWHAGADISHPLLAPTSVRQSFWAVMQTLPCGVVIPLLVVHMLKLLVAFCAS